MVSAFVISLVSEIKFGSSFLLCQSCLAGYMMLRLDWNSCGGSLSMHVKEIISVKQLNLHKDDSDTLILIANLHLRKSLIIGAYKPPEQIRIIFLENLSKSFSIYRDRYMCIYMYIHVNMYTRNLNIRFSKMNSSQLKITNIKGSSKEKFIRRL